HPSLHTFPTRRSSDLIEQLRQITLIAHSGAEANPATGADDHHVALNNDVPVDEHIAKRIRRQILHDDFNLDIIADLANRTDFQRSEEHTSELQSLAYL